jgi:hypothetical protein
MRKPKNIDAELKALEDKARMLKERKVRQLGELVIATGADGLDAEVLAGVLVAAIETRDPAVREGWRQRGAGFFQQRSRTDAGGDAHGLGGPATA